jgi:hypothetical protein
MPIRYSLDPIRGVNARLSGEQDAGAVPVSHAIDIAEYFQDCPPKDSERAAEESG